MIETMSKTNLVRIKFKQRQLTFGDSRIALIAGPCSIESREHFQETATGVARAGANFLRAGIYKMRTQRESFQGLGATAFSFVNQIKDEVALPLVSEITDPRQISDLADHVEMFQVGSRNMYNYELLKELGQLNKPVLLKRAFAATVDEWLKAADYVAQGGSGANVILCERGIRTFETTSRNTLDLNSVAYLKAHSSFPILVDPSHGTGRAELVQPMALAAIAAGADGLVVEVHPRPKEALSDAAQAIDFSQFTTLVDKVESVAMALGRKIAFWENL